MPLYVKRLTQNAKLPLLATDGSAGFDLYADEDATIPATSRRTVKTGIAIDLDPDKAGLLWPRSGLARSGIDVKAGLIDPDYRGEILILLTNTTPEPYRVRKGDRIAQLIVVPAYRPNVIAVDEMADTARGANGFGHTGR